MSYPSDNWEARRILLCARNVCGKYSIMNDLGIVAELTYIKEQIRRDKALNMPQAAWIDEISKRMSVLIKKVKSNKICQLQKEVGLENVNAYLAAAILALMENHGLITFRGADN